MATENERLNSEIQLLEAMFFDSEELSVQCKDNHVHISVLISPHTAMDSTKQFVQFYLDFDIDSATYPSCVPSINLSRERGISESDGTQIKKRLQAKANELIGSEMLYALIDEAKELLTNSNKPSEDCAICLCSFDDQDCLDEDDQILKTPCFHYFHRGCFAGWWQKLKQTPNCPVCRSELNLGEQFLALNGLNKLIDSDKPAEEDSVPEQEELEFSSGSESESESYGSGSGSCVEDESYESVKYKEEAPELRTLVSSTLLVSFALPRHLVQQGLVSSNQTVAHVKERLSIFGCYDCEAKILKETQQKVFLAKFSTPDQALFAHANFSNSQVAKREYFKCKLIYNNEWDALMQTLEDLPPPPPQAPAPAPEPEPAPTSTSTSTPTECEKNKPNPKKQPETNHEKRKNHYHHRRPHHQHKPSNSTNPTPNSANPTSSNNPTKSSPNPAPSKNPPKSSSSNPHPRPAHERRKRPNNPNSQRSTANHCRSEVPPVQ